MSGPALNTEKGWVCVPVGEEQVKYPKSWRFLRGRLRHLMSDTQKQRVEDMVETTEQYDKSFKLISRGDACTGSTLLIDGFMLRTMEQQENRYSLSFHVPGDFVDLHCFVLRRLDHDIVTVGPVTLGFVPHEAIQSAIDDDADLARLLWFSTLLDAALHREWILKLEQLTAPKRIAHIFAEIWRRLEMVGLARSNGFNTPLTQTDLAEMCGATAIHANRALRDLRERGLAEFRRGRVYIESRQALEDYAQFSPDYLYGEGLLHVTKDQFDGTKSR